MKTSGNIHTLLPKVAFEKSRLLSQSQYKDFAASRDLNEFVLKLRKTEYEQMEFRGKITLKFIEFELKEVLFSVFEKIIRGAPKGFQRFFLAYLLKYELDNIKTLIRGIYRNLEKEEIQLHYSVERILGRNKIFLEGLNASDIDTLVIILQQLPYGDLIKEIIGILKREKYSFFYLDLLLDLKYLEDLWLAHQKLSRRNRNIVKKFLGLKIDYYNLETILRAKNLQLEEHLIYRMISPHYYQINYQILDDLIKNRAVKKELLHAFQLTEKSAYIFETPEYITPLFNRRLLKLIHYFYLRPGFNIGKPFAFLLHKELEVENLRTISVGVHYRKSTEEIMNKLYIL